MTTQPYQATEERKHLPQEVRASGVVTGTSATKLSPEGSANRAQMATILMRFVNL